LVYDQDKDTLGEGKFNAMWHGPYIVRCLLKKSTYELVDYEGNVLVEPRNGIYLKRYYTLAAMLKNLPLCNYCVLVVLDLD
jgi:hypothetical protein